MQVSLLFLQASNKLDQFKVDRNGVTRNLQHNYLEENVIDLDEVSASEGRLEWRRRGKFPAWYRLWGVN